MSAGGKLVGIIGDEDTVTGFLLAGVGQRDIGGANFFTVTNKTKQSEIEENFKRLSVRPDIAIILINQHVANMIRHLVQEHVETTTIPTILEIPSKEHPYDPSKDPVMRAVSHMLGLE
jgi:V-type H+-transporting ATPase subunit F